MSMAGMKAAHLLEMVILPVLARMARAHPSMDSLAARHLLLGTAAHESLMGHWLRQEPTGPARGIYQMETATFDDNMKWLLRRENDDVRDSVMCWTSPIVPLGAQVAGNLYFATALARVHYWRRPFTMPATALDAEALAAVWKKWWNTPLGAGTVDEWLRHYRELAAVV